MVELSRKDIRGAIRTAYHIEGLTQRQIAERYRVNIKTVSKWIKRETIEPIKKVRKTKLKQEHKNYIYKLANGKFSGRDNASIRKITQKLKRKFKLKISKFPVQQYLKETFQKPKRAGRIFYMNQRDKISRKSFAKWIIDTKKISGNQIFFTDEKTFCLNGPLNPQTNQIRLSIKDKKD